MSGRSIRSVLRTTCQATAGRQPAAAAAAAAAATHVSATRPCGPTQLRLPASCQGSMRLFSTTAARDAHAIDFLPSSSPELDDVLETIRLKILIPSYLRAEQRRQLFSPRFKASLRVNPITLEIDGEVLRFTGMDRMKDQPNARAAAREAVGRMTTREDFENLPRLLEGLHNADRRLRPADYARIARRAGERGCIYAIIDSARTVRRTGFRLATSETVAEILTHVQLRAVDSAWAEAPTRQALTWAEMVVDMLDDEQHGRRPPPPSNSNVAPAPTFTPPPPPPSFPLALDPQVLAARLHLAAVVAAKFDGGADVDGKVARYAAQLVRVWPADCGLRSLHPPATYADRRGEMHYLSEDNKFLGVAAPLLHGLDAAIGVVRPSDGALADALQVRRDVLGAEVAAALTGAPDRRGAAIYKKLFED